MQMNATLNREIPSILKAATQAAIYYNQNRTFSQPEWSQFCKKFIGWILIKLTSVFFQEKL